MKRRNGLMKAYALIAAAALMLSGCGDTGSAGGTGGVTPSGSSSAGSTDEKIVIGASFPLTGTIAADGQTCVDAINLAIKQANEAGGINGREIALVQEDDEGSPTSAASIAMSVPAPIAMPVSAVVSAGASFMPSPIIITLPYS